jgi:hypothetical protein
MISAARIPMTDKVDPQALAERLEQLSKRALYMEGGTGGRMKCRYCLRESYPRLNQPEHYVASETRGDCEAIEMQRAAAALRQRPQVVGRTADRSAFRGLGTW